ncbi:endo-1,4-beta-xylanase [Cellvibrio zantedeschiae]|uniref:Endo-1,4-beta-xylanase n=1 Tax=Cellvibrio zantedeschiae TaxID=1237077 RepID=A0ABQ3B1B2_9GAMM|nr:alpha/beta hydrolase [Cellvibrio zantedeschiae]GGY70405.1 endo-1,4-beta-xylanase [Cellvibrio zantedeschiae]
MHKLFFNLIITAVALVFTNIAMADEPQVIYLWKKGAPGFEKLKDKPESAQDWWVRDINNPSIVVFKPPKEIANSTAILVAPGGGHRNLVFNSEGRDAAQFLNKLGITVFVLKYRLARQENSPYSLDIHPQQDAYRAMRTIRSRAAEFGIDPNKIGIMGFSAGGEVVASVAYGSGDGDAKAKDPIDRVNGKPNFQILVYPGPLWVPTSLDDKAPPAFMVAAMDDACCAKPIIDLAQLYHAAKIPAEIHLYAKGDHAFNMGKRTSLKGLRDWPQRLADWLIDSQFIPAPIATP